MCGKQYYISPVDVGGNSLAGARMAGAAHAGSDRLQHTSNFAIKVPKGHQLELTSRSTAPNE
jgi:hypothetical protein